MIISKKIDFALVFSVKKANPNGDPLNGNRPRIDYNGFGEVSDVCLKRKIRNRLQDLGEAIFVQSDDNRVDEHRSLKDRFDSNPKIKECQDRLKALLLKGKQRGKKLSDEEKNEINNYDDKIIKIACESWFDVRAFGQVFPFKKEEVKDKKAENEEVTDNDDNIEKKSQSAEAVSIGIRGPVSIQSAVSVETVDVYSQQITKSVKLETDSKGSDTMGMKHRVEHGIYVTHGSINCQLAEKTGFSEEDAEKLKQALITLFENDASSARPEGSMEVVKVFWWKHNCKNGQYSSAKVHRSLHVNADGSYTLDELDGLTPEIYDGK